MFTTFDATSRIVAHQEVHIDIIIKQAKHLQLPLVGVPLHRTTKTSYVNTVSRGLKLIKKRVTIVSLVFGDLHLQHIRDWRDKELGKLDMPLEYPLWKIPYSQLIDDLEDSKVPCRVSAVTTEVTRQRTETTPQPHRVHLGVITEFVVQEGLLFDRTLMGNCKEAEIDSFGENGEFHSVAEVWGVNRETALGL